MILPSSPNPLRHDHTGVGTFDRAALKACTLRVMSSMNWTRPGWKRPGCRVASPENLTKERTIIFQSLENYWEILSHPRRGKLLKNANVLSRGLFGKRVLVEGCPSSKICVGGVYSTRSSLLMVEVTSPYNMSKTINKNSRTARRGVVLGARQRQCVGVVLRANQNYKDAERG